MADSDITIVGLQAIAGASQIGLSWLVEDPNAYGLPYLRYQKAQLRYSLAADMSSPVDLGYAVTAKIDAPVSRAQTRYYQARAINQSSQAGDWCSPVAATEISGEVLLDTNGHWQLPNGLTLMWGVTNVAGGAGVASILISKSFNFIVRHISAQISAGTLDKNDTDSGYINLWSPVLSTLVFGGGGMSAQFSVRRARAAGAVPSAVTLSFAPDGLIVLWKAIAQKV